MPAVALRQINARTRPAPQVSPLSRVGWSPDLELDLHQWKAVGRNLGRLGRYSPWWLGDWLLYGRDKWGEMYTDAAKITGYDYGSLRNIVYVAQRFELSRRRDNLAWTHHADVASLDTADQDYWLDRAVELRLSTQDLRTELRTARRRGAQGSGHALLTAPNKQDAMVICPKCGEPIRISRGATKQSTPRSQVHQASQLAPPTA